MWHLFSISEMMHSQYWICNTADKKSKRLVPLSNIRKYKTSWKLQTIANKLRTLQLTVAAIKFFCGIAIICALSWGTTASFRAPQWARIAEK